MTWLGRWACMGTMAVGGCATTGDPQQGGLFGWSEHKARERQEEKHARVGEAEAELANESARSASLHRSARATDRELQAAQAKRRAAENDLRAWQSKLIAKTERLEAESPTPATASRARALRLEVNTTAARTAYPPERRVAQLRALGAKIDEALAQLK